MGDEAQLINSMTHEIPSKGRLEEWNKDAEVVELVDTPS